MPQNLDEDVVMSTGPGGPDSIQARDPMCEATGRKLVRAVEAGGGGGGGGLTDEELRAAPLSVIGEVETIGQRGGLVDRSGSITTGGTSQQLADANGGRLVFFMQNLSVETLWLNFDDPATADGDSIKILPNGYWEAPPGYMPTSPINILGATTGSKWVAKEA